MPKKNEAIEILKIEHGEVDFCVLGATPMLLNRMPAKAKRSILNPQTKNRAEQRASLKHDPLVEFQDSVHSVKDGPTLLSFPCTSFKSAMATAALEMPGATKTSINRLCYVVGDQVAIYGVPQLHMGVVRQAGMNRAPDIRTRAILPEWACYVRVRFIKPQLSAGAVSNLLAAAGHIIGIGDFRQEKGKGNYGLFDLVDAENEDFRRITGTMGREPQLAAMREPVAYSEEAEELWSWFEESVKESGKKRWESGIDLEEAA